MLKRIKEAAEFIIGLSSVKPDILLILDSELFEPADEIENAVMIPYESIPFFPRSTGKLYLGTLAGKNICCMQGGFHLYEGYKAQELTFPLRVAKMIGCKQFFCTNQAGGITEDLEPGDLMLIKDHIYFGENPLTGANYDELGERFPDMSKAYSKELIDIARAVAKMQKIDLKEGVYMQVNGPSYSTKAELGMMKLVGVNAVGMSSVPEIIIAVHQRMKVVGISVIADSANHLEILKNAEETKLKFKRFVKGILEQM